MGARLFNDKEVAWLKEHVAGRGFSEITKDFNKRFRRHIPMKNLREACIARGIHSGIVPISLFNADEIAWLGAHAKGRSYKDLTADFNAHFERSLTINQIIRVCAYRCFKTGTRPSRVKNNRPWHYVPVGEERRKGRLLRVKVSPDTWKEKHIMVWENAHGPVPPSHVVVFADQNHDNCSLENLVLITRSVLAVMNKNRLFSSDAELTRTGIAVANLMSKTYKCQCALKKGASRD